MPGLDPIVSQLVGREVGEVTGNNNVGPAPDRRGQDVPVVRVGQVKRRDQVFVPRHQAVADVRIHQVADSLGLLSCNVRVIFLDIAHPLFVDGVSPPGSKQVRHRQIHQQAS